MTNYNIV